MVTIINYNSGEIELKSDQGPQIRLDHQQANRLVLAARMRNVEPFIEKLAELIGEATLVKEISAQLHAAEGSDRWNLKEKFARLHTIVPGIEIENPDGIFETVTFSN